MCCSVQIRQAASGLDLTEEQFVELQSQHWARFYSICVQYQQVLFTLSVYMGYLQAVYFVCVLVHLSHILPDSECAFRIRCNNLPCVCWLM